ncbi:RNA polymerase sigma factor [Pontiella agarivorans]|uniref:RNA polymerase sigma factor SigS n=1 Tax=Pontiella agarivorans TaxID=3038953 RepID=A0ABU5MY23_9BACT|nr:sigma-70 family RNA polymerase sigma factor [Pontiella agarivorans]MDZ8119069.1 sigma-70 family RNA polymerase sigma factor [Pontiella agarivorans]
MREPIQTDTIPTYSTRKTLIERVQDQYNEAAWEEFAAIYTRYIYAVIRNMNLVREDAEEIHQKVILKLWEKLPDLNTDEIRRFRSYLAVVTKNEVRMFIRSRTRRRNREDKAVQDHSINYLDTIRLPEIDQIAEREWEIHLIRLAIERVKPQFSKKAMEVFKLNLEGIDIKEISERTGIAPSSVTTLKARVKSSLVEEIKLLRKDLQ